MCCYGIISLLALIIGFGAIVYLVYQFYSFIRCGCGKYGPFVSTYGQIKEDILNEARAVLKKSKKPLKVTDLGCGSGALLIPLAKEFPEHQFIGYEWDIVPLTMGKIKAGGLKNIKFVQANYMEVSHKDMDLILCYVLKTTGEPLGKKLNSEIKDSCVVISEMFPLGYLKEIKQINSSIYKVQEKIFVYEKNKTTPKKSVTKTAKTEPIKAATKKAPVKKVALAEKATPKPAAKKTSAIKAPLKKAATMVKKPVEATKKTATPVKKVASGAKKVTSTKTSSVQKTTPAKAKTAGKSKSNTKK